MRTHAVRFESESVRDEREPAAATARALGTTHSQTVIDDTRIATLAMAGMARRGRSAGEVAVVRRQSPPHLLGQAAGDGGAGHE
jgi:hypothetical protein